MNRSSLSLPDPYREEGSTSLELTCCRCGTVILPEEQMVMVSLGRPYIWSTPCPQGRWHYRCAPKSILKYVRAVST